jgi:hypothetical protein
MSTIQVLKSPIAARSQQLLETTCFDLKYEEHDKCQHTCFKVTISS